MLPYASNERSRVEPLEIETGESFARELPNQHQLTSPEKQRLRWFALASVALFVLMFVLVIHFATSYSPVRRTVDMVLGRSGTGLEYRNLELTNGLKVVLVSGEEHIPGTSVWLCVGAGILHEPVKQAGLANIVASAVGHGYDWNSWRRDNPFVVSGWGVQVLYDKSCFFFKIRSFEDSLKDIAILSGSLDRFVQHFIAPDFDSNLVHALLQNNWTFESSHDDPTTEAVLSEDVNPEHPLHYTARVQARFNDNQFPGTTEGLQKAARDFFKRNYVANNMSLVVASGLPLDNLQDLVGLRFSRMKAGVGRPHGPASFRNAEGEEIPVFKDRTFEGLVYIQDKDSRPLLRFSWRIPEWHAGAAWSKKPWLYTTWALAWEGRGSILSHLERKGWAFALIAGVEEEAVVFQTVWVEIYLTKVGLKNIEGIGKIVFAYLALLKANPTDWVMEQEQRLGTLLAYFQAVPRAIDESTLRIAERMLKYPPEYVLIGQSVILNVDQQAALNMLDHFSIEAARVEVVFPSKEDPLAEKCNDGIAILSEGEEDLGWEEIKYSHEVDADTLTAWKEAREGKFVELGCELKLPGKNPYIVDPSSFKFVGSDGHMDKIALIPGEAMPRIYHQTYSEGEDSPVSFRIIFAVYSKELGGEPAEFLRWRLWGMALDQDVDEEFSDAAMVGMYFDHVVERGVLRIELAMYGDSVDAILKRLAHIILNLVTVPQLIKEKEIERLQRKVTSSNPIVLAHRKRLEALSSWAVPWDEQLKILEGFTGEDLNFDPKKVFQSCFIEAFVIGNVLQSDAKRYVIDEFASVVEATPGESPKFEAIEPLYKEALLPETPSLMKVTGVMQDVEVHIIHGYLQVSFEFTPENHALLTLLVALFQLNLRYLPSNLQHPRLTSEYTQVTGFTFTLKTRSSPDCALQNLHQGMMLSLGAVVNLSEEDFDKIRKWALDDNDEKETFHDEYMHRHPQFESRMLSVDHREHMKAGLMGVDLEKAKKFAEDVRSKGRFLYVMVPKTKDEPDAPDPTPEEMKENGLDPGFPKVNFTNWDGDAFKASAEWKELFNHDLTKP